MKKRPEEKTMEPNYEDMSIGELEAEIQRLDVEKQNIRAEQLKAHAVLDQKNEEIFAQIRIDQMSEPERKALLQALQANGIDSAEQVQGTK